MEATILLKSVAILSLFYLVYWMAFRKETHFVVRRHFFLIGLICAICLPFVVFETVSYVQLPAMKAIATQTAQPEFVPTSFESLYKQTTIDWMAWLWMAYGLGLAFFIGQLLIQLYGLARIIRRHRKTRLGGYTFVEVDEACAPFSFFRYIVYNPALHSREELEMILQHEKVHASQWHTLDLMLANLLRMLQWFNPFSWLYKKSMEENLEFIADRETAQQVTSLKQYQLALVKASSTYSAPALTTQFYQSFIKKRIIMLNKQSSNNRNILKLGIIIPILCVFLWSFNVKEDIQYLQPEPTDIELTDPMALSVVTEEQPVTEQKAASPTDKVSTTLSQQKSSSPALAKDIKIKFHKDLTEAQLKDIKKRFKSELGLDLSYTTVRNKAGEITSIDISYTGDGQSGNYSVSDDDGPIDAFYFFKDEDGEVGFWSEALDESRKARMALRKMEREKREQERQLHMTQRERERESRRAEVAVYRAEERANRQAREVAKRLYEIDELKGRVAVISGDGDEIEVLEIDDLDELKDKEGKLYVTAESRGGNTFAYRTKDRRHNDYFVVRDSGHMSKNAVVINKDATDVELLKMKADLMEKGVDFKYSRLKRNANGEITRIKITVDDNKGSNSTVTAEGKDGGPIKKIVAAY